MSITPGSPARDAHPLRPLVDVRITDVTTFYRLYDAARGRPPARVLQRYYIDAGTAGVRQFVPHRIVSGEALAREVAENRLVYQKARACMQALPAVKRRLGGAFRRLAALVPDAAFPPVTIVVGRNNSGGTTGPSGVLIGLEVVCRSSWLQPDPADRLYHLIAHEYGHVLQPEAGDGRNGAPTVLEQSLVEGVAELVAELISGQVSNVHLARWAAGRARTIDERFLADADKTDLSPWLYDGVGDAARPGDLGYWVGHRIARAYFDRAGDKRRALATLLALRDPKAILRESGWRPGE